MAKITVEGDPRGREATGDQYAALEAGDILYFPTTPFTISPEDRDFLLGRRQVDSAFHKNISYRPAQDRLKGVDAEDGETFLRMQRVMRDYSRTAINFTTLFLRRYARDWKVDFASFRPIEEQGRKVSLRARNDLIHFDSFPTRPSHGDRLLRIFTNIHPERARVWVTSDNFETLALSYARPAGLPANPPGALGGLSSKARRLLSGVGLPVVDRPAYDRFMLRFHHFLKQNAAFQQGCRKDRWEFPSGSTWIVFTDASSHSCISGQYALEQTFIVRRGSLARPDKAPIAVLERMTGFPLVPSPSRKSA